VGVKKLQDFGAGVGFETTASSYVREEQKRETLKKELKKFFQPEFLNRIDEVIIFNSLNKEDVKKIVRIEMGILKSRLDGLKYHVEFDDSIVDMISEVGFDEMYGARPLKRAIQDKLEDFISEEVIKGVIVEGGHYTLIADNKEIKYKEPSVKKGRKKKEES